MAYNERRTFFSEEKLFYFARFEVTRQQRVSDSFKQNDVVARSFLLPRTGFVLNFVLDIFNGHSPRERCVTKNSERNCCENCRRQLTSDITVAYFEQDVIPLRTKTRISCHRRDTRRHPGLSFCVFTYSFAFDEM